MANAAFDLTTLNGSNGFTILGTNARERLGFSISDAGDINGDGIGDLIVGAPGDFGENGNTDRGRGYIIFGAGSFAPTLNAAGIDGSNGFIVDGINAGDNAGISVSSAGDINNDGIGDFILGNAFSSINGQNNSGSSYVILGSTNSFGTNFNPASLNGGNGFILNGLVADDRLGNSVNEVGDVNQDGFVDFLVGAPKNTGSRDEVGTAYLVYGKAGGFDASLNLSSPDASKFTKIDGLNVDDLFGVAVNGAGDVNGDGINDMVIGASSNDTNGVANSGNAYVIFGTSGGFGTSLSLANLNGSNGFVVNGFQENAFLGFSVSSAGDINKDGIDDVVIGARGAGEQKGAAYVVFGSNNGFAASINAFNLDGSNGFAFYGYPNSQAGFSVSGGRDFNGDSIDDIIVGAAVDSASGEINSGSAYVIFGKSGGFSREISSASINRSNGIVFNGLKSQDLLGSSVSSAGDVNGGGVDDIAIGAPSADNGNNTLANNGAGYVIAGENFRLNPTGGTPFEVNNSGFTLNLAKALDLGGLNIYDGVDASADVADVVLVRNGTENIRGSLTYNPTNGVVNFIKTGGVLEDGSYSLTLRSGSDGFIYSDGSDLNLDGDNNIQTSFTTTFNVNNGGSRLLNVSDVSSGLARSAPVAVTLNDGNGVDNIQFNLRYDPQLLEVIDVILDPALAGAGWTLNNKTIDPVTGTITVQAQGNALGAGTANIISLDADTQSGAIYNSSGLLSVSDTLLNGGAIASKGDTSLQQVTLQGDVSGDGSYGAFDAALVTNFGSLTQSNAGFDVLSLVDPNIIGDVDGSGGLSIEDSNIVLSRAVGLS